MKKRFKVAGAVAGGLAFSLVSLGGVASAQSADDVTVLLDNLPTAAEELAAGLQEAVDTLATTQSAVETSAAAGEALVASGMALVEGSEQFGALGLGLALVNLGTQNALQPYLQAIDDPSTAGDLVNPDDLGTIGENVQPTVDFVQGNLTTALVEGLQGNLVAPGLLDPATGTPSALGNTVAIGGDLFAGGVTFILLQGTNFEGLGSLVPLAVIVGGGAAGGVAGEYLVQAEDASAPLFEAAAPVTAPIVEALQGI